MKRFQIIWKDNRLPAGQQDTAVTYESRQEANVLLDYIESRQETKLVSYKELD